MNKKSLNKLNLFFLGIKNRLSENVSIFNNISITYSSGLKSFSGSGIYDSNKILYSFNGTKHSLNIDDFFIKILNDAENYDSLSFTYSERGTNILITADNKNATMKTIATTDIQNENKTSQTVTSPLLNRNYLIKVGPANPLLEAIGILTKDGKVKNDKIRKYSQIDHFIELIEKTLDKISKGKTLTILDCGCGKSYLTFALNYYLVEVKKIKCHFIGLDISPSVIDASKEIAKKLGYKNMEFHAIDIKNYNPTTSVDMVISLHACDTATDMALALGIKLNASAIIAVPCCHKEMLSQYKFEPFNSITKHGVFKARLADTLTDGMRSLMLEAKGYDVSVTEYISPLETPKNLLINAIKTSDYNDEAMDSYMNLMGKLNVYPALYNFLENGWQ
ncbi:class I SAM-dependent methyltransferase [Clostridium hydrogenum]|uniref:class I SAM-dependent methyltransferase n=1 Tax=Clostridium hydrogenum TaxID=2855764 RepID=UPI001F36CCA6|nr:SAM-dependent methyltransferase [Clostridium hydrogenum]